MGTEEVKESDEDFEEYCHPRGIPPLLDLCFFGERFRV